MIKDRMPELLAIRQEEEMQDLGIELNDVDPVGSLLDHVDRVQDVISSIREKVHLMKILMSDIVTAPMPDVETKQELKLIMLDIKQLANIVRSHLKQLDPSNESEIVPFNTSPVAHRRMGIMHYENLCHLFLEAMNEYNQVQVSHHEDCKRRIRRQLSISGKHSMPDEYIESLLEANDITVAVGPSQTFMAPPKFLPNFRRSLKLMEERQQDIYKLEERILEVHDLFLDIHNIVLAQSETIDSIERKVSEADSMIDSATKKLKKAKEAKKKCWLSKLCCF